MGEGDGLLKLYLAANKYEDELYGIEQVFAGSKDEAIDQLVENRGVDEFEEYHANEPFQDVVNFLNGKRKEIFQPLADGEHEVFKKNYFRYVILPDLWDVKEYDIPEGKKPYIYYDEDFGKFEEDVSVVFANDLKEAYELAVHEFAEKEYISDSFREHVNEKAINFGVNEDFLRINDEYVFSGDNPPFAEHVYELYPNKTEEELNEIINVHYRANVRKFFADKPEYAEQFIDYNFGDYKPLFNEDFYLEMCKKLVAESNWINLRVIPIGMLEEVSL